MPTADLVQQIITAGGSVTDAVNVFGQAGEAGKGIVTLQPYKEGSLILSVPVAECLYMPHPLPPQGVPDPESASGGAVAALLESGFDGLLATALLILHEMSKGEQSQHAAHFASCPEGVGCPFTWSPTEQSLLAGTTAELTSSAGKQLHKAVRPLMKRRSDLWDPSVQPYAAFCKAAEWVQSRAFHINTENWVTGSQTEGETLFLIPLIDMVNHSSLPDKRNASLQLDQSGKPGLQAASFCLKADRDIAPGEEVLISYGDLSSADLLTAYGFVEEPGSNPHDSLPLDLELACQYSSQVGSGGSPASLAKRLPSIAEALLKDGEDQMCVTAADPCPPSLTACFQALVLPRTDSAAFLKACAEAEVLQELEIVPEACAAMLCTAKAGLQQRQKRPIMAADVSSLSSAQKLARRLLEVEMGLLRSWQAAAAEMLQETLAEGEDADRGLGSEGSDSGSEDSQQALEVASAQHRSSTRQTQAHDITPAGDNKRSKTEF